MFQSEMIAIMVTGNMRICDSKQVGQHLKIRQQDE